MDSTHENIICASNRLIIRWHITKGYTETSEKSSNRTKEMQQCCCYISDIRSGNSSISIICVNIQVSIPILINSIGINSKIVLKFWKRLIFHFDDGQWFSKSTKTTTTIPRRISLDISSIHVYCLVQCVHGQYSVVFIW